MVNASTSALATTSAQTGFTYINDIITGASAQGVNFVIVEDKFLTPSMVTGLTGTHGFKVTTQTDTMGLYKRYLITW